MQFTFGVLLTPVAAGLAIDRGAVSLAFSSGLFATATATDAPLVGCAADRIGLRRALGLAILLVGAVTPRPE